MNRNGIFSVVTVVFFSSCATWQSKEPVSITTSWGLNLDSCINSDGGGFIYLEHGASRSPILSYDWILEGDGILRGEVTDSIGQTLAAVEMSENVVKSDSLPLLAVDRGWLVIDGNKVPIDYRELGCLLRYKIPQHWAELEWYPEHNRYRSVQKDRTLILEADQGKTKASENWCLKIEWPAFLWWQHRVAICVGDSSQQFRGRAKLPGDYELFWRHQEQ